MTDLVAVLEQARRLGFLGPGPVEPQVRLSQALAEASPEPPESAVDLGSGAGLPGLVLAQRWSVSRWMLLDSSLRRTSFLQSAVAELGLQERVTVVRGRAEEVGRSAQWRGQADLVVARSFGPPAVTAECGAPLLRLDGRLVVAEPPGAPLSRWLTDGLALVGLEIEARRTVEVSWISLRQARPCPDRYPRRVGIPAKRPLFRSAAGPASPD